MNNAESGRILVVDDETEVITVLCNFLSELGYEAVGYTSGKDALDAFKEKDFDLLMADLIMPEMDGITLIKSAQAGDPNLVSLIITGHGTIQTAVEAMKIGAFDYITKPLDWKMLRPIVSRAMEIRRLRKSEERYRTIVEDQTELICRWHPDGTITFVNEVYCRYFNKSCQELTGRTFEQFIPSEDHKELKKEIAALNKENPVSLIEHRVILPDGEVRWQSWTNRVILDEQGNIIEIQSVGRDITVRKLAEENLRISHEQLRALTKRLSEAEEKERQRIARELHDQVGQNLTALGINLNMLRDQLYGQLTSETDARFNDSIGLLEETTRRIRDVMADLRPSVLDDYGLIAAIRWYSDQFSKRTGLNIAVHGEELIPRLPSEAEITLFRITQEVLTNVAKHAMAENVTVTLKEVFRAISLIIVDDGVGFDPALLRRSSDKNGWGILNIQERAESIGGKLTVESRPGEGTAVIIEMRR
jgi:two-component system sensor histidine kinase UhpB